VSSLTKGGRSIDLPEVNVVFVTCSNSWKSECNLNAACPLFLNDPLDFTINSNIMLLLLRLHP